MEQLKKIISDYENGEVGYEQARKLIFNLTGKQIEQYHLDTYWGLESIDGFIRRLTTKPILDWKQIEDDRALILIKEILKDVTDDAILERNGQALEKRYGKPQGMISDYIFHYALDEPEQILEELKKDTRIIL